MKCLDGELWTDSGEAVDYSNQRRLSTKAAEWDNGIEDNL